ncbi:hypothetical protein MMPV_001400 [Pyropia vietnamensis]
MAFLPPPPLLRARRPLPAVGVARRARHWAGGRRLAGAVGVPLRAAAAGHPCPDGPPTRAHAATFRDGRDLMAYTDEQSVSRRSSPLVGVPTAVGCGADDPTDVPGAAVDYLCPEGHYWEWTGGRVHYVTAGTTGPVILMLPGFGVGTFHWEDNMTELARDHRVFCMDKLGLGRSLPAPSPDTAAAADTSVATDVATVALPPLGVDLWAVQVTAFIEAVIGEPVYLAGNSLGGLVALTAAAARSDLVRGVVLLNAAPFFGALPHPTTSPRLHAAITVPLRSSGAARWVLARFWSNLRDPPTLTRLLRLVYATPARVTETLVDQILAPTRVDGAFGRFTSMLLSTRGERGFDDALDVVAARAVPLAMINGREDVWVVPAWGHRVKRRAPDTAYFELSPAGHCPHAEAPAAVNAVLRAWVAAIEGGGELPMREVDAAPHAPAVVADDGGNDSGGGGGDHDAPALGPDTEQAIFDGVSVRRLSGRPRGWLERLMTRSVVAAFIASSLQTLADHPEISHLDIGGW